MELLAHKPTFWGQSQVISTPQQREAEQMEMAQGHPGEVQNSISFLYGLVP